MGLHGAAAAGRDRAPCPTKSPTAISSPGRARLGSSPPVTNDNTSFPRGDTAGQAGASNELRVQAPLPQTAFPASQGRPFPTALPQQNAHHWGSFKERKGRPEGTSDKARRVPRGADKAMTPDEKRAHKATLRADRRKREEWKSVDDEITGWFAQARKPLAQEWPYQFGEESPSVSSWADSGNMSFGGMS